MATTAPPRTGAPPARPAAPGGPPPMASPATPWFLSVVVLVVGNFMAAVTDPPDGAGPGSRATVG